MKPNNGIVCFSIEKHVPFSTKHKKLTNILRSKTDSYFARRKRKPKLWIIRFSSANVFFRQRDLDILPWTLILISLKKVLKWFYNFFPGDTIAVSVLILWSSELRTLRYCSFHRLLQRPSPNSINSLYCNNVQSTFSYHVMSGLRERLAWVWFIMTETGFE